MDEKLKQLIRTEFKQVMLDLTDEFTDVIEDPAAFEDQGFYSQDIVDTGRLRDSQDINETLDSVSFSWDPVDPETGEHYAMDVYRGFFAYGNPNRYVPGRRWPQRAMTRFRPVSVLADRLRTKGLKVSVKSEDYDFDIKNPGLAGPV